jgi:hypothetical protein
MSNEIPKDTGKESFPISPLFAENTPEDVMQWVLVEEALEVYWDQDILDKIGIRGEAREQLMAHMTRSRLPFRNIIKRGMGFEDDGTKLAEMTEHAQQLVDDARLSNIPPETDSTT